jgi:[ribosomal protein S5]-alanine N-acetyltransferase
MLNRQWPALQGTRVNIRPLRRSDLTQFQRYRSDSRVALYQDWLPMSEQSALEYLNEMASVDNVVPEKWIQLGMALPQSDLLVGDIGLFLDQSAEVVEIGITLAQQYQGQGLATEAIDLVVDALFKNTGVSRVRGITDVRNIASIRLLERAAFVKLSEQKATVRGKACAEYVFERRKGAG